MMNGRQEREILQKMYSFLLVQPNKNALPKQHDGIRKEGN